MQYLSAHSIIPSKAHGTFGAAKVSDWVIYFEKKYDTAASVNFIFGIDIMKSDQVIITHTRTALKKAALSLPTGYILRACKRREKQCEKEFTKGLRRFFKALTIKTIIIRGV